MYPVYTVDCTANNNLTSQVYVFSLEGGTEA